MHAVILAAGEGMRLRPLTRTRPKPMVPIANRPLLEYVVEAVADAGFDDIVLVVGYKRERIQSHFGDGNDWGVDITYAVQEKQLGTGHAVEQAESYVDDDFVVLNGDRIIDSSLVSEVADASTPAPALAVSRSETPSSYGVVEVEGNRVLSIEEKPPEHTAMSELINAGVYKFTTGIFDVIRNVETVGEVPITAAFNRLAVDTDVWAVRYDGRWLDVSEPWDLLSVNAGVLDTTGGRLDDAAVVHDAATVTGPVDVADDVRVHPNATVLAGTSLGDNAEIGANAVVSNSVVLPDATIRAGTVLRDCVVGSNSVVGPNCTAEGGLATLALAGELYESVRLGAVVGDNATLAGGVTLAPGSIVGNNVHVYEGATVDGPLEDNATVRRG
ncbi:bifunctional sugar-1-phosphate nucleotidylyltransferase/acetyltransferase [Salinigranum salinum]|uniref:bifunctional sugar-1-phosphate nucleotidylyltransferase/acetyltransferase n=1 Tax=Salinigranum salinum TaxID=1364937 RepID=UPI001260E3B5|nr:bifunctional sugar-1-phosphate nucleotidylyltransferase/acetyltransferase [Salinigranum salinum]